MYCSNCQKGKMKIVETRQLYNETFRRRKCLLCDYTIYTMEITNEENEEIKQLFIDARRCTQKRN